MADVDKRDVLALMERAYQRIESPERWTQGEMARNKHGMGVDYRSKAAVCWCSMGALAICANHVSNDNNECFNDAVNRLDKHSRIEVDQFNDTHTHAEVLAVWRKAIDTLRAELAAEGA